MTVLDAALDTLRPPTVGAATLVDLALGLAAARPLWTPHAHHGLERQPVRLVAADAWEAWVIGWSPGHQVEVHDHGLSAGALAVADGELTELVLHDGGLRPATLREGSVHHLPPGHVHDVVASERATSIHVYAPALTTMTYYDERGRPAWTTVLEPQEPVVDLRSHVPDGARR